MMESILKKGLIVVGFVYVIYQIAIWLGVFADNNLRPTKLEIKDQIDITYEDFREDK